MESTDRRKGAALLVLGGALLGAAAAHAVHTLGARTPRSATPGKLPSTTGGAPVEGGPQLSSIGVGDDPDLPLRRLRKVEAVIQRRTSRLLLVVERATRSHNYSAILRTAEALGVHHVWVIAPPSFDKDAKSRSQRKKTAQFEADAKELEQHVAYARRAGKWLELRAFGSANECIAALRADGRQIWVSDLSQAAVSLTSQSLALPERVALVMGTESTGASPEMLLAADRRVYLPLHGFADSLNLSVAAAMLMQRLMFIDPTLVGGMSEAERTALRTVWYPKMGRNAKQAADFAAYAAEGGVAPLDDVRRCDEHRAGWVPKKVRLKNEKRGFFSGIGTQSAAAAPAPSSPARPAGDAAEVGVAAASTLRTPSEETRQARAASPRRAPSVERVESPKQLNERAAFHARSKKDVAKSSQEWARPPLQDALFDDIRNPAAARRVSSAAAGKK